MTPPSEYRGLNAADKAWLENFNAEWTASNCPANPEFNEEQRRESYRRRYHRRLDGMNRARYEVRDLTHNPVRALADVIDSYQSLQRGQPRGKKRASKINSSKS